MRTIFLASTLLATLDLTAGVPAKRCNEYEYVVVGSGPGGGTLAANLARAGHSVFLIEAGQDHGDDYLQAIPAWADLASEAPDASWQFFVNHFQNETQAKRDNKFTYRLDNGSYYVGLDPPEGAEPLGILYPRGATLGGSGQSNAMNFALPPDNDWTRIAQLTGDNDWLPENMRNFFVELEINQYLPPGVPGHGYDGYIESTQNNLSYVVDRPGVVAVVKEGIRRLEGINVESEEQLAELLERDMNRLDPNRYAEQGVYRFPLHIDNLKRRSGARDYVVDTLQAKKEDGSPKYPLTVSYNSLATRVLFSNSTLHTTPRAYGVEYLVGEGLYAADSRYNASQTGELATVRASREVIVAGGAFNTPQILKLSGVGPREELEALGIHVVSDLPAVGAHMHDNYEGGVTVRASVSWENNPYAECRFNTSASPEDDPCLDQWVNGHNGPYGEGGAPLAMWIRSSDSDTADSDIFGFGAASAVFRGFFPGYSTERVPDTSFFWSMVKMNVRDQAGTVTLRSADPRDTPLINFNWFQEGGERDLQALGEAVQLAMDMFEGAGAPYAPYEVVEPTPGVELHQAIKDNTFSHHVQSTCRMGPKGDRDYCVDSKFRVNGVEGLRVVDASVFPHSMGAFPVAPTFVASRKAFHDIVSEL